MTLIEVTGEDLLDIGKLRVHIRELDRRCERTHRSGSTFARRSGRNILAQVHRDLRLERRSGPSADRDRCTVLEQIGVIEEADQRPREAEPAHRRR